MYDVEFLDVGSKIKIARKEKQYTLDELGDRIGRTKSAVYKYESNAIIPDFLTLLEICNVLDIKISDLCDSKLDEEENERAYNPFDTDKLYLYYIGYKGKLIGSSIKIANSNNRYRVYLKNSYKDKDKVMFVNEYIGSMESDKSVTYLNLRNDPYSNDRFEKIQIIINLKYSLNDFYIGSINATTDSNNPTTRKCIITKERVVDRDELNYIYDKLLITKDELENIEDTNYWNMPVNTLEE